MKNNSVLIIFFTLCFYGCSHYMPVNIGMTRQQMLDAAGEPTCQWIGTNGVECYKYELDGIITKDGLWFMVVENGEVTVITPRRRNLNNLRVGMPEEAVCEMFGNPANTSEVGNVRYLYFFNWVSSTRMQPYYVGIVDGHVESYGLK